MGLIANIPPGRWMQYESRQIPIRFTGSRSTREAPRRSVSASHARRHGSDRSHPVTAGWWLTLSAWQPVGDPAGTATLANFSGQPSLDRSGAVSGSESFSIEILFSIIWLLCYYDKLGCQQRCLPLAGPSRSNPHPVGATLVVALMFPRPRIGRPQGSPLQSHMGYGGDLGSVGWPCSRW